MNRAADQYNDKHQNHKAIIVWLGVCAFMVFAMTIIGAITRLTESGLSMVEWRPLIGALPPMNEVEWQRVFSLYQETPEFQKKNFWMDIKDFKTIFFWEWFHRLWGRLIGVCFALPLFVFWIRGIIPCGYKLKFLGMLGLGGLQGLMGWYMVMSGLVDNPAVSHYRLAAHLSLALIIFVLLIKLVLSLMQVEKQPDQLLRLHLWSALVVLSLTVLWGAFVAGLDAGLLYNDSFPHMGGAILPPDINQFAPFWLNFVENPSGVQFIHRWLAIATMFLILSTVMHGVMRGVVFNALYGLGVMVFIQFALGLITLFSNVHIHVAAAHQAGAVILLGLIITCIHQVSERSKTSHPVS